MPEAPAERDTRRARLFEAAEARHVPLRAILTTVGVVVVVYLSGRLIYKLRTVVLLVVVASFIALLLNPAVVILQRRIHRRGFAVGVVTLVAVMAFLGLALAFGYPLVDTTTTFASHLGTYVSQAEHGRGWVGHLVARYHVEAWVKKNAPKLTSYAQNLSKPALNLGKGAVSLLFSLFVIFMLVLLLLLEGPKLRRTVLGMMTPARAHRYTRIAGEMTRSVTGYMLGNFITSMIAGVVVFVTLFLFGVPYSFLWALWVALVDFLPLVGGALAGIPTVLFAFTHSLAAGIATLIVFIVYTQVENHILNPVVMSRTVRINPLLVLVAVLVGADVGGIVGGFFGGFVGALLAIPVASSIQVLVREVWRSTESMEGPPGGAELAAAMAGGPTTIAGDGGAGPDEATGEPDPGPTGGIQAVPDPGAWRGERPRWPAEGAVADPAAPDGEGRTGPRRDPGFSNPR